jgi:hypothetical protein
MTDPDHHHAFIEALKTSWRAAGGPLSLTGFLRECRPVIAPLLARGVSWAWIGARVLAVYIDPKADVPVDIAPLEARKKTLIQLYSRTTLRADRTQAPTGRTDQAGTKPGNVAQLDHAAALPPRSTDPPPRADLSTNPRERMRQSASLRKNLGHFESVS